MKGKLFSVRNIYTSLGFPAPKDSPKWRRHMHSGKMRLLSLLCLGLLMASCQSPDSKSTELEALTTSPLPEVVDYNFHIKPLFSDRCFTCHGPDGEKREAELSLHTKDGLFASSPGDSSKKIIVPGEPALSLLYQRISDTSAISIMPPIESNLILEPHEIALIEKWIQQGAKWKPHWAFTPPQKPAIPEDDGDGWAKNEIDHFLLASMQMQGLSPSEAASPNKLIRRLSLDVNGIPPELEDVATFEQKPNADSYAQLVDKYLASTDHAERFTVWWLDLSRYADTNGYQDDLERQMWPWRDWVIHAFEENMSFDQFVTWQLAGDLLPDANLETILATGFNRNHKITQEGGVIDEEFLVDYVADRTVTTFTAFQAITMECARCHDHKYDPLSQKEFYQAFDFFNRVPEKGRAEYNEFPKPFIKLTSQETTGILAFVNAPDSALPVHPMVMEDEENLRTTHILNRGQYDQPAEAVQQGTPASILPFTDQFAPNRLGLAQWLFDTKNPLTARVIANRIWALYFQRGIVSTLDDFGNQGSLPTHPELLDWMATFLMESDWDLRALERKILTSAAYQQQANIKPLHREKDPGNIYLSHANSTRLSAELIRDQALSISGLLVDKVGGPPVKPYQPDGLWAEKTSGGGYMTYKQQHGEHLYRKSLYTYWKRTVPPPSMLVFDAPTRDICTVNRQHTNTPLQALVLLNDPQQLEAARKLAGNSGPLDQPSEVIGQAFRRVLCRKPETEELNSLQDLFNEIRQDYSQRPSSADSLLSIGESPLPENAKKVDLAAMTIVVSTILNMNETITRP